MPKVEILGVEIARAQPEEAVAAVEEAFEHPEPSIVAYANAHTLNLACSDRRFRDVLLGAHLVFNDGIGIDLAARLYGRRFPSNLNGSDLNRAVLGLAARKGWRVFLLGARGGVAEEAADQLRRSIPGLNVVGCHDGFFPRSRDAEVARGIARTGPDVVMVAMGNPHQEMWLSEHLATTGARLGIGVGAFLDFSAGRVRRAPRWMNRFGIEWVWRLMQEPRRLWRRYIVGSPLFLWRVMRDRFGGKA